MVGASVTANFEKVTEQIREACKKSGRQFDDIKIIAVAKGQPIRAVNQAIQLEILNIGENYVQEYLSKKAQIKYPKVIWHFIGHMQTNKVRPLVGQVETIQSMDRFKLAEVIDQRAQVLKIRQKVFLEVNVAGEETKSGVNPAEAEELLRQTRGFKGLDYCGIMIMPPPGEPEASRPFFAKARQWLSEWKGILDGEDHSWNQLSMGTSHDFMIAIEEGATCVRLGTCIFGPRIN